MEKICSKCLINKPLDDFGKRKTSQDGHKGVCKNCEKDQNKKLYESKKEQIKEKSKQYYYENHQKIRKHQREYNKQYREENKEKIIERINKWREQEKQKEKEIPQIKTCSICDIEKSIDHFSRKSDSRSGYRSSCKECSSSKGKEYYIENKEELNRKGREWKKNNPEKHKKIMREYCRERRKTDPSFKLRENVGRAIRAALLKKKDRSITTLLPYTMDELKSHLEGQFSAEMSWENYGTYWEIDHIYPQSLLPFSSLEEKNFQVCWSLSNLQPLPKKENKEKSNKI